ncbi:MmgE/PrpD family protein [Achromobacter aloeverae]
MTRDSTTIAPPSARSSAHGSAHLSALYTALRGRDFPPATRAAAKSAILDGVGCILAGVPTGTAGIVRATLAEFGGRPQASILGTRERASIAGAAMANGVAGHVIDYDDTNASMIGHPSTVLAPVILALGEAGGRTGDDVVRAYIVGFEIETRLGRWMNPGHYGAGWHATSSLGIFGAAAAACHLLDLDAGQFAHAVGIAASASSGLRRNFGSMTKSFHAGHAAERGIWAAVLAGKGFTASPDPFSGDEGFLAMYRASTSGPAAPEAVDTVNGKAARGEAAQEATNGKAAALDADGPLELDTVGIGVKPYPCCGAGLTVIDAMLDLCASHRLAASQVVRIDCAVSAFARRIMPFDSADDELQAKYCLPYCLAVALLDGRAGLRQFDAPRVREGDVQRMMERVHLAFSDTLATGNGRFGVDLRVSLSDGRVLRQEVETPRGHPARPLSAEELADKFVECAETVLNTAAARQALARLQALDDLPNLSPLLETLRPVD